MLSLKLLTVLDPTARTLRAGELRAVFLPGRGMLGASLTQRGNELLGRVQELASFAQSGRTCGIPLLYPWANRLQGTHYDAAGQRVSLDAVSARIGHDGAGLPMHGVPWPQLTWQVVDENERALHARLDWTREELMQIFPFPHHVALRVTLDENGLNLETTIFADAESRVPISFGFHPYLIADAPRAAWRIEMPALKQLELDAQQIPNGETTPFPAQSVVLGERDLDDGFALENAHAEFVVQGGERRFTTTFLEGFRFAQIFAPRGKDYIAIEPMTAPTNALVSGRGLRVIAPGEMFRATFRIDTQEVA